MEQYRAILQSENHHAIPDGLTGTVTTFKGTYSPTSPNFGYVDFVPDAQHLPAIITQLINVREVEHDRQSPVDVANLAWAESGKWREVARMAVTMTRIVRTDDEREFWLEVLREARRGHSVAVYSDSVSYTWEEVNNA